MAGRGRWLKGAGLASLDLQRHEVAAVGDAFVGIVSKAPKPVTMNNSIFAHSVPPPMILGIIGKKPMQTLGASPREPLHDPATGGYELEAEHTTRMPGTHLARYMDKVVAAPPHSTREIVMHEMGVRMGERSPLSPPVGGYVAARVAATGNAADPAQNDVAQAQEWLNAVQRGNVRHYGKA